MPREKKKEPVRKRKPAYYWWILANVVAACLAVLSWVVCLHIFQHPEIPRNYEIIRKLGQAQPPLPLTELTAPPGEEVDPRALYNLYASKPPQALKRIDAVLMRNYLSQLKEKSLIKYIKGDYRVEAVRQLNSKDLFSVGFAVRARAMIKPDEFSDAVPFPVIIDYMFPTQGKEAKIKAIKDAALEKLQKEKKEATEADIPEPVVTDEEIDAYAKQAMSWISPGDLLGVSKFPNCAMILHVELLTGEDTPVVCVTVTPSAFGEYTVGAERRFLLSAPMELHPGCTFPIFSAGPARP